MQHSYIAVRYEEMKKNTILNDVAATVANLMDVHGEVVK